MKNTLSAISLVYAIGMSASPAFAAMLHWHKMPMEVLEDRTRPCAIFRLDGVAVADPSVGGEQWFAIPKTHPSYAELYALLLTAKAGDRLISVGTTGGTSCGFADIDYIVLD